MESPPSSSRARVVRETRRVSLLIRLLAALLLALIAHGVIGGFGVVDAVATRLAAVLLVIGVILQSRGRRLDRALGRPRELPRALSCGARDSATPTGRR